MPSLSLRSVRDVVLMLALRGRLPVRQGLVATPITTKDATAA
jgi:hypothetical protein